MSAPFVGKRVTIEGLASRPELNGQTATAESFDSGKCRYNVRLRDGSMIALRPASLIAVPGQSDDAGGGGSPFGGFGGMPGMGGGMPDMAQAQAMLQQLQAMLPAGVTPQRAGMCVLAVAFVAWRFLSLKIMLVLGAVGYAVCTKLFAAEFKAAGGGVKGAIAVGRACVQKVRARLSAVTGFQVTETTRSSRSLSLSSSVLPCLANRGARHGRRGLGRKRTRRARRRWRVVPTVRCVCRRLQRW